ncbi:CGNR zinc finger domain-containing protein [Nocardioides panacisoli]|uniref:Zinc finger CGNR domain-containing protein n=1 Tax=Nocardioides panacisoli TaxID=627624 RepID=A0ABP7ITP1_9ACTN
MVAHPDFGAPDDEDFLVALANTGHVPGSPDELRDAASVQAWWEAVSGAPVPGRPGGTEEVALLRAARDVVRRLGLRNNGVEVDIDAGPLAALPLRLDLAGRPGLTAPGRGSLARDLAARAAVALIRLPAMPTASRFKACPGPGCAWVFVDTTRNGSRRWCHMAACGNRAKAAAFRARSR